MFGIWYLKLYLFRKKFRKLNSHNLLKINDFCDIFKIKAGKKSYGTINLVDFSPRDTKLFIGSYCSIAPGVQFLLGGEHNLNTISTYPFKVCNFGHVREAGSKGDITVGDDVWIGTNAIICSGVSIGQGAVVAAGAIVTKNVEPYAIVAGNPAKVIKYRFEKELRESLINIDIVELFDGFKASEVDDIYSSLNNEVLEKLLKR